MCDTTFDLNKYKLYINFMVQWFSLISWRLKDGWMYFFRMISQCDSTFYLKINIPYTTGIYAAGI